MARHFFFARHSGFCFAFRSSFPRRRESSVVALCSSFRRKPESSFCFGWGRLRATASARPADDRVTFLCSCKEKSPKESTPPHCAVRAPARTVRGSGRVALDAHPCAPAQSARSSRRPFGLIRPLPPQCEGTRQERRASCAQKPKSKSKRPHLALRATFPCIAGKHRQDCRCLQRMLPAGRATRMLRILRWRRRKGAPLIWLCLRLWLLTLGPPFAAARACRKRPPGARARCARVRCTQQGRAFNEPRHDLAYSRSFTARARHPGCVSLVTHRCASKESDPRAGRARNTERTRSQWNLKSTPLDS